MPTLVAVGDRDFTRVDQADQMAKLIPGAQLAVLPGTKHVGITRRGAWLATMVQAMVHA